MDVDVSFADTVASFRLTADFTSSAINIRADGLTTKTGEALVLAADWIGEDDSDYRPVLEDNTFYVGSLIYGTGSNNGVAVIDYVAIGVIPEPRSIGLLLGAAGVLVLNRNRLRSRRRDRLLCGLRAWDARSPEPGDGSLEAALRA